MEQPMYEIKPENFRARPHAGDGFEDGSTDAAHRRPSTLWPARRGPTDPNEGRHPACRGRRDEVAAEDAVREDLFNWF
jgi:hypothetical protein